MHCPLTIKVYTYYVLRSLMQPSMRINDKNVGNLCNFMNFRFRHQTSTKKCDSNEIIEEKTVIITSFSFEFWILTRFYCWQPINFTRSYFYCVQIDIRDQFQVPQ